jgi:hypothetical protein
VKNGTASTNGTIAIGTHASADGDDADASAATGNSSASDNDNRSGSKTHTFAFASTAVQSSNSLSSFGGTGLYNISQNNGNNSVLQSGNTVAAIVGK